jgi:hypothetical protein
MLERMASWSVFAVDTSLIEDGGTRLISFFLKIISMMSLSTSIGITVTIRPGQVKSDTY